MSRSLNHYELEFSDVAIHLVAANRSEMEASLTQLADSFLEVRPHEKADLQKLWVLDAFKDVKVRHFAKLGFLGFIDRKRYGRNPRAQQLKRINGPGT